MSQLLVSAHCSPHFWR